jgi:cation diffusion facilitator CzcD-associated flavoprotein CzcO
VLAANFSTSTGRWTVHARDEDTGKSETYTSRYLLGCTGYYDYAAGYRPEFPGEETFTGVIVHPQHWPEDLDYTGKRIIVIGSGATAITLVPAMAGTAEHVTMLQRSPSYVLALPSRDGVSARLRKAHVPLRAVYAIGRVRNIAIQRAFYGLTRVCPALARRLVLGATKQRLRGRVDMKHFTPTYDPWDQRLCVVPDGDLFKVLRNGSASVVTDRIERLTPDGITLVSGEELPADIIVAATGLSLQMLGGIAMSVDTVPVDPRDHVFYKGVLLDGIPNSVAVIGYTNASWTLKADLAAEYFCRLVKHMDAKGFDQVVAVARPDDIGTESLMGSALSSGYVRRAESIMPRQGTRRPWRNFNDYVRDAPVLRYAPIENDALHFTTTSARTTATESDPAIA